MDTVNPAAEATPESPETNPSVVAAEGTPDSRDLQAVSESVDPLKAKPQEPAVDEDPEIELDKDLKIRKSELTKQIKRRKELDRAAFEKFQQAAEIRKQLEGLQQSDPEEYFRLRGVDPIQYAVERLQREVALRDATPEQRRSMELEQALHQERAQREEYQSQIEQQQADQEREHYSQKLDKELPVAMQKHGLHTDPMTFSLVAQQIRAQILNDHPEDYEAAAEAVAEGYRESFRKHTSTLKYEDAVKAYPELVKVIRDGDLARAKSALPVKNTESKPNGAPRPQNQPKREWAMDDWASLGIVRR